MTESTTDPIPTESAPAIRNVLFLCTGNSARSILAEAALARRGVGRFRAFSAGSHPKSAPHPGAIETLQRLNYDTAGLRSKSWQEFADPFSPRMDFIITVCDNAAGEACPIWPGQPISAHWGVADPASFEGGSAQTRAFFKRIHDELASRIERFLELELDGSTSESELVALQLAEIGRC